MDVFTVLLGLGGTAAAGWITAQLVKAKKVTLVKDLLDAVADGEVTKEELEKLVADLKALFAKK